MRICMKVHDLITELNKHDRNLDVILYCEDLEDGENTAIFEIDHISVTDVELGRDKNDKPGMRFRKSNTSNPAVIIQLISDN